MRIVWLEIKMMKETANGERKGVLGRCTATNNPEEWRRDLVLHTQ